MKLLILTRYARQGASSRMRAYQYQPWLEAAGIEVSLVPLFSDAYVLGLQMGQRFLGQALVGYWRRLEILLNTEKFDLVWIEKESLPWLPIWFEGLFMSKRIPYVLDYDDAVFHYYDLSRNFFVKTLLGRKHPALMRGAALVMAGNGYLADTARFAGAKRVEIVPTVIDLNRYPVSAPSESEVQAGPPCVGWIGQNSTAHFLIPYIQLFERLASKGQARFAAIGINASTMSSVLKTIPWAEHSEVASIASFDTGIMPLVDAPFERGKCGYKLIQYMACGLPVVASPVGVNCQIVEHGVNGFLAETPEEWEQALVALLADPSLRQRMGTLGRRKVEEQYCVQVTGPLVADLLMSVIRP